MRVLIIGGSGFIGRHLARRLGAEPGNEVFCTFRSRPPGGEVNHWHFLELTDPVQLEKLYGFIGPQVVVHLAAQADVGTAEREPQWTTAVNVDGTAAIARLCRSHGARLVFVSTEYVFSGRDGCHREEDNPDPTSHYGRTKAEAEAQVALLAPYWSILRTSIVYGWPGTGGHNFVPRLIERLGRGETYAGDTGAMRSPIYVERLVDGLVTLVEDYHPGIHHVAGRDWVSMYDFARAVAGEFGLDANLVVPEIDRSGPPDRLGLDCSRTMSALGLEHHGLGEGLAAMRAKMPGSSPA